MEVQNKLPSEPVRVAFMQFDGPTLPEVVAEATANGAVRLTLVPLFMASAGHVDKDIKPLVEELKGTYPELHFDLQGPVGEHPAFSGFIVDHLKGAE
jgi:sirohydrochlorin ferrochelatase